MRPVVRGVVLSLVTALLALLAAATPAAAVVNGETVDPAPSWIAAVYTNTGFLEDRDCTGSVITTQWVLTAAHCVLRTGASGPYTASSNWKPYRPKSQTSTSEVAPYTVELPRNRRVAVGASDAASSPQQGLRSLSAHPGFRQTFYFERNADGKPKRYACDLFDQHLKQCRHVMSVNLVNDFALLQLNTPTTATPLYLGTLQQPDVTAYGYGRHTADGASDALLRRTTPAMQATVCTDVPAVLCATPAGSYTAPGDSGGPWVQAQSGGALVQVGVTSFGTPNGRAAYGANVSAGLPWIRSKVGTLPTPPTRASGSSVLVVGTGDEGDVSTNAFVSSTLAAAGYQVTTQHVDALPTDLSAFGQIWDVSTLPLSTDDQQRLIGFAKSGGGVFLTGERPCCEDLNAAATTIVNSLVVSVGGIQVGGLGDPFLNTGPLPVNPAVRSGVATRPFTLSGLTVSAPGGMGNVSSYDVLISTEPDGGGVPTSAAWGTDEVAGGGRLVVLMDINWGESGSGDLPSASEFAQNVGLFLSGLATPPAAPVPGTTAAAQRRAAAAPAARPVTAAP